MRKIGIAERRARLGVRHRLASPAANPIDAARAVVALHATDPTSAFLSAYARTAAVTIEDIERTLYQDRALLRLLGMRRTMFVVPVELAPAVHAAAGRVAGEKSRKVYLKYLAEAGHDGPELLQKAGDAAAETIAKRGEVTGAQLSAEVPLLRRKVTLGKGKKYESQQSITPWVLILLAAEGRIVRSQPVGSWTSTQWRWAPTDDWLPGGLPDLSAEAARAELARSWLAAFGPGTAEDLKWWTGWTMTQTRQALQKIEPVEVELAGGGAGLVLPDDVAPVAQPEQQPGHWVALLPALDPTPMGWSQRQWYLGEHGPALFDKTGNIGPSVWCEGRIVGGWAQRPDGEVVYRLLEDIGGEAVAEIDAAAERLAKWIGAVFLTPRGRVRAPLEQELLG